ncbi:unannotated protein [freshwater metagenome]|uniref:Unannotated protein n=1 Tax=freshwater metagenome TaxID=449393 RepID=A0A6J6YIR9_9ZZZZ
MVVAIKQADLDVHHGETGERTRGHCIGNTVADRRDVFLRNSTTRNFVCELVTTAGAGGLDGNDDLGVLTCSTSLLLVQVGVAVNDLGDGFTVGNLGLTHCCFYSELSHHAVNEDLEVQLAHARNQGLTSFFIGLNPEGGVFFRERIQSLRHFVLISLGLGLYSNLDNGVRELKGFEYNHVVRITQRVTSACVFQADSGNDVSGVDRILLDLLIGMHFEHSPNAFFVA